MVYDRLNSAVDGLVLGNGTVYNFIDYIGRMHLTGGIARYTLNRGYFFNNISSNYEGGLAGRYGYGKGFNGNSEGKTAMDETIGKYVRDNFVENSTTAKDRVGDYYTVNGPLGNSELPFTSIDDFSLLGTTIREEDNLPYNANELLFKDRHFFDGNDTKFEVNKDHPILPKVSIGDEIVDTRMKGLHYTELFGGKLPLFDTRISREMRAKLLGYKLQVSDSQGVTDEEREKYNDVEREVDGLVFDGSDITEKRDARTARLSLEEFGKFERSDKYENLMVPNKTRRLNPEVVELREKFDEYYVKDDGDRRGKHIILPTNNNFGLFDFYGDVRQKYGKEYINGWKGNTFWYGKSYGVVTNEDPENYNINSRVYVGNTKVDPSFTRGSFRTNSSDGNANYGYYQENDLGKPVLEFKDNKNTSEGFTANIDTFNNASMIMRKMNGKFFTNDIKSLINRFHTDKVDDDDQLITAYDPKYGLSRGRNLLKADHSNDDVTGFNNPYCRVWTAHYQYSKMKDRIRPFMNGDTYMSIKELQSNFGRMRPNGGAQRLNDNSVLMDNGFVKVTPFNKDGKLMGGRDSLKKYMFSIENLAWKGFALKDRLSDEQRGPYGGRIMWFPPYNLKFNENINVDWQSHDFIGRGEKIYTYKNTDRSGTLDFSILIDHPSIINKAVGMGEKSGVSDEDILRFFAGCGTLEVADNDDNWDNKVNAPEMNNEEPDTTPRENPDGQYNYVNFIMFFPNNFSAKKYYDNMPELVKKIDEYEMESTSKTFLEMDAEWADQKLYPRNYDNRSKYGLNSGEWDEATKEKIKELLVIENTDDYHPYTELKDLAYYYSELCEDGSTGIFGYSTRDYEIDSIVVRGFASDHGYVEANKTLAKNRAETIKRLAKYFCNGIDNDKFTLGECLIVPVDDEDGNEDVNRLDAKIGRSAIITFKIKMKDDVTPSIDETGSEIRVAPAEAPASEDAEEREVSEEEARKEVVITSTFNGSEEDGGDYHYTYQNEFMYFKYLESTDPLEHKRITDSVRYFNPAFHSITPEGFNARLNFLQQCTRQGPTIGSHSGGQNKDKSNMSRQAANMSFGMAPYCILRIGDFYYSKIVIDSMSMQYDAGNGVQYDMNPEGIGIQPMMANISINFHFIGGQDIEGPVQQLQNALSYNYYANSSIYTPETQAPMPEIKDEKKE